MAKQVILTDIAERDLEHIIDYLIENWGAVVCEKFLHRFEQVCEIISYNPTIYPIVYHKEKNQEVCFDPSQYRLFSRAC